MNKKKIIIGGLIIFLSLFFLKAITSSAQEGTFLRTKSEPIQLNIDSIYIPCENPSDPICSPYPTDISEHPVPNQIDHELSLSAENFPPNVDVYIVGCIDSSTGARCSTGDSNLDNLLNGIPGGNIMSPDPSHQFKALKNPVKTSPDGILENVIVRSFTPQTTSHYFISYYITQVDISSGSENITSYPSYNSIQLGEIKDFTVPTLIPTLRPTTAPRVRRARQEGYDPKGRLFDSQSLEPIPEGEVILLDNLKKIVTLSNFKNPQQVKSNGEFTFWVPNGIYYLEISKKPLDYIWPIELNQVHPNYKKAYYCDPEVKDEKNQPVSLYINQYPILEYNKLVHCDVPLSPQSTPYRSDVKTIDFSIMRTDNNTSTLFAGKVSHPLTKISLKGETTERVVATTTADKLGFWQITLKNSSYPLKGDGLPDRLIAVYKKIDLTGTNTDVLEIKGNIFEPILTYVEGYAYSKEGELLPLAKVGYKQLGLNKNVFITTADKSGFFKIPTQYLPSFSYEIVFLPVNSVKPIILSTSEFLEKNLDYLGEKKLNLLTNINKDILLTNIENKSDEQAVNIGFDSNENKKSLLQKVNTVNRTWLIIIVSVLLAFSGVVITVFIRNLNKKNKNEENLIK